MVLYHSVALGSLSLGGSLTLGGSELQETGFENLGGLGIRDLTI